MSCRVRSTSGALGTYPARPRSDGHLAAKADGAIHPGQAGGCDGGVPLTGWPAVAQFSVLLCKARRCACTTNSSERPDLSIMAALSARLTTSRMYSARTERFWTVSPCSRSFWSRSSSQTRPMTSTVYKRRDGTPLWKSPRVITYSPPAVTASGLAYVADHAGLVHVFDVRTGAETAKCGPVGTQIWSSTVVDRCACPSQVSHARRDDRP
jgi:hypothetical protein